MTKKHTHSQEPQHAGAAGAGPQAADAPPSPSPAETAVPPAPAPAPAGQEEVAALKDRLLRLQADFDNFRKRSHRERAEHARRAVETVALEFLNVVDHFELGLQTADAQGVAPAVRQGFQLVYDQMCGLLGRIGITPIEAQGRPFDPHQHESLAFAPSPDCAPDHVVSVVRKGYLLDGRLLRPARVVVSSGPPEPPPPAQPDENADDTTQG